MDRFVCIHGHFYQPPRENPWLEGIEVQDSAYPYHDWNERITLECYAPNAASRILDDHGRIVRIVNNYSQISFNVGPTLLAWLETEAPETYNAILHADRRSMERFGGHGSAMAQPYNHMIMPLANRRDKRTQVLWGIRDFEKRFERSPAGMWLPETAVDLETLDVLVESGIRFTVLAPYQAGRVRRQGTSQWQDVRGGRVDPTRPYIQRLPSGREIVLFFYDGPISRAVAFEDLLRDGEALARRLLGGLPDRPGPKLMHIATDGETYGHHHRHGDMALAYALHHIQSMGRPRLTNYSQFLAEHPPEDEVEIVENTSWSCAHGIERWRSDCGCNTGRGEDWNQAWRTGLRDALDWLRDELSPRFERVASRYLEDPWAARDAYIDVILNREPWVLDRFLEGHAKKRLTEQETVRVLQLLEAQRHAQLMYTSCGWFFDELSGIETVQVIEYAGRAVQLAEHLFDENGIEAGFVERLEAAKSNLPEHGDGGQIYEDFVRPVAVDLLKVGGHYAVSTLFEPQGRRSEVYCYRVRLQGCTERESGKARLAIGHARIDSLITRAWLEISFAAFHFGDHNVTAAVSKYAGDEAYAAMSAEIVDAFDRGDFAQTLRLMDKHFEDAGFSLKSLFRDQQRVILDRVLRAPLVGVAAEYRRIYEEHTPLLRFLGELGIPLPNAFQMAAEFVLNTSLVETFENVGLDLDEAKRLLAEARSTDIALDTAGLGFALEETLETLIRDFARRPDDVALLVKVDALVEMAADLPFEVNLWAVQNVYYEMARRTRPDYQDRADRGDASADTWLKRFARLGERLTVAVAD